MHTPGVATVQHQLHELHHSDITGVSQGDIRMPAKASRITFTPAPETFELLTLISNTTGQPLSAVCRDCMGTLTDHLRMLSKVVTKVKDLQNGSRMAAMQAAATAESELGPILEEASRIMLKMVMAVDEIELPFGDDQPPSSNTGATLGAGSTGGAR